MTVLWREAQQTAQVGQPVFPNPIDAFRGLRSQVFWPEVPTQYQDKPQVPTVAHLKLSKLLRIFLPAFENIEGGTCRIAIDKDRHLTSGTPDRFDDTVNRDANRRL